MKFNLYKKLACTLVLFFAFFGSVEKSSCMLKSQKNPTGQNSNVRKVPKSDSHGNMTKTITTHQYNAAMCCMLFLGAAVAVNLGFSIGWYYNNCN